MSKYAYSFDNEEELQFGIEQVLIQNNIKFERELRLDSKSRIDFFIDGIGIEVKIKGTFNNLLRQVHRYVQYKEIKSLIIVTNRSKFNNIPTVINNKRVILLYLLGNCF